MNYTEVITTAKSYTDRANDIELPGIIDSLLRMVESRFNRKLKQLEMSTRSVTNLQEGVAYYSLPPDFRGARDVEIKAELDSNDITSLTLITPEMANHYNKLNYPGTYYSIVNQRIQIIGDFDDGDFLEVVYYIKVPELNSTDNTNWVTDDYPDLYVFGLAAEICVWAKDYEAAEGWLSRVDGIFAEMKDNDDDVRWSGAPLQIRREA